MSGSKRNLTLSQARAQLSPLVQHIDRLGTVEIRVRGQPRAYLISAKALQAASPRHRSKLYGSLKGTGALEATSKRIARELFKHTDDESADL